MLLPRHFTLPVEKNNMQRSFICKWKNRTVSVYGHTQALLFLLGYSQFHQTFTTLTLTFAFLPLVCWDILGGLPISSQSLLWPCWFLCFSGLKPNAPSHLTCPHSLTASLLFLPFLPSEIVSPQQVGLLLQQFVPMKGNRSWILLLPQHCFL